MNMLRHFYNDFMALVPLQLPQLIDVTTMEKPQFYGDYVLLTFPLRDSYDLEEVMDMFEDDMELITLYHHIPMRVGEFGYSTCAYSNPAFGQMFKVNDRAMRNTLYRQMVYWINMYRTWIKVADDNLYKEHIISRSDRTDYVVSRTLVLRAFKANGQYAEGTTWEMPRPLSAWRPTVLSAWNS